MAEIVAVVPDLMFGSRVRETLTAEGHEVTLVGELASVDAASADGVVADLNEVDPDQLAAVGAPVLGFYSHVDTETRRRAERAGIELVVPRSRMAREMSALVERLLSGSGS